MTFVFAVTVLILIFVVMRRWLDRRRSATKEERAARAERWRMHAQAMHAQEVAQARRTVVLEYVGGHPELREAGICRVSRDEQGRTVEVAIGHQRLQVDTSTIVGATLLRSSDLGALGGDSTSRSSARGSFQDDRSGLSGRGRGDGAEKAHRDTLVWTLTDGTRVLFRDNRHRPLGDWYMQTRSILERHHG